MTHYQYLIVGGGMTAAAAMEGIRSVDPDGSIGVIGAEQQPPYNRPPLTKGLWSGKPLDKIWRKVDFPGVEFHLGRNVAVLDPTQQLVVDDLGNEFIYESLLLATGGKPRHLPGDPEGVIYYRTLDDYQRLRGLTAPGRKFAVIGASFIGSEITASLAANGQKVSLIFPGAGIGDKLFPADLSAFITDYYREKGVEVFSGQRLASLVQHGGAATVRLSGGREIMVDGVVAGIGILPNTALAETAGLKVEDGIQVDDFLRTSQPNIFAAGDVANFYSPALHSRTRVEHEDNANQMGKAAGENMARNHKGQALVPYTHLPFFYSDLFDLGYEAVGEIDSRLETYADWQEPFRKGVVYYLQNGAVRGVLLWNVWDQVEAARKLIGEAGPFEGKDLQGRLGGK